jgi:hypothetical protein
MSQPPVKSILKSTAPPASSQPVFRNHVGSLDGETAHKTTSFASSGAGSAKAIWSDARSSSGTPVLPAPRAIQNSVPVFTSSMKSSAAPTYSGSISGKGEAARTSLSSASSSSAPVYKPSSAASQRPPSAVQVHQQRPTSASNKPSSTFSSASSSASSSSSSSELEAIRERERQKKLLAAQIEANEKAIKRMKISSGSEKKDTKSSKEQDAVKEKKKDTGESKHEAKKGKDEKRVKSKPSHSKRKRHDDDDEAEEGSESDVSTESEGSGDSLDEDEEHSEEERSGDDEYSNNGGGKEHHIRKNGSSAVMDVSNAENGSENEPDVDEIVCVKCGKGTDEDQLMLCDGCDDAYHTFCVGLESVPENDFFCKDCPEREVTEEVHEVEYVDENGHKQVRKEKFRFEIVDDVEWEDKENGIMDEEDEPDDKDDGDKDDEDEKAETDAETSSGDSDDDENDKKKARKEKMEKKKKSKSKTKVAGKVVEGEASKYSKEEIAAVLNENKVKRESAGKKGFNNFLAGILLRSGETDPDVYKTLKLKPIKPNEVENYFGVKFNAPPKNPPKPKGGAAAAAAAASKPQYQQKAHAPSTIPPVSHLRPSSVSYRDGFKNYFHPASKRYYQFDQSNTKWSEITGSKLQQIEADEKKARVLSASSESDN